MVARSSTEAENQSLTDSATDLEWTRMVIKELGINVKLPLTINCDNMSANYLAKNSIFHSRAKHVAINYHFVRERVVDRTLIVKHIGSVNQPEDLLTKLVITSVFNFPKIKLISLLLTSLQGRVKDN